MVLISEIIKLSLSVFLLQKWVEVLLLPVSKQKWLKRICDISVFLFDTQEWFKIIHFVSKNWKHFFHWVNFFGELIFNISLKLLGRIDVASHLIIQLELMEIVGSYFVEALLYHVDFCFNHILKLIKLLNINILDWFQVHPSIDCPLKLTIVLVLVGGLNLFITAFTLNYLNHLITTLNLAWGNNWATSVKDV